jgi:hypothetical protein
VTLLLEHEHSRSQLEEQSEYYDCHNITTPVTVWSECIIIKQYYAVDTGNHSTGH